MSTRRIEHLVVDAVGFLKCAPLQEMGVRVYSVRAVVDEIRDPMCRQRLHALPFELILLEPDKAALGIVTDFSKKTGDFPSLSATDLQVLAVTYMLEVQHKGRDHLNKEPTIVKTYEATVRPMQNPGDIIGFHIPALKGDDSKLPTMADANAGEHDLPAPDSDASSEQSSEEEDEEEVDDSDWITPDNVQDALLKMDIADETLSTDDGAIPVACLTTDFAMQNVLLHMGLQVVALDGLLIGRLKTFTLRCRSCFATTSVMSKQFCPRCGNASLHRVAVTVNPDGTTLLHLSRRKAQTTRGLKYSLPTPKGGKHAADPVLFEDQRLPHNRLSRKALACCDPLDVDYVARESPFLLNDVTSRSALLGLRGMQKATSPNPNAAGKGKKRGGKKR